MNKQNGMQTESNTQLNFAEEATPYKCVYCGQPSWLHPHEQSPPVDYCHEGDHGSCE